MANSLTGEFDGVLQLSGPTLDRLAATMHQNDFRDHALPSLPHNVYFRLDGSAGEERGSVSAQIGTPHIDLIDGATDRFWVEMGFRARFRADPGSPPLADVIHGSVRAIYRFDDVDPSCPGWAGIAGDYAWLRVVQSSVTFTGSARNDATGSIQLDKPDQDRVNQRIGKHLAKLLATQFQPTPQRMSRQFRRFITRSTQWSSGVAFPVALEAADDAPVGQVSSIARLFLGGHDFAVGISADYIVRKVQAMANVFHNWQIDITYRHSDPSGWLDIDYHFKVESVSTQWLGGMPLNMPGGLVKIRATGVGWASWVSRGGVYNIGPGDAEDLDMTAAIEQVLMLQFDAARERVLLSAFGEPIVDVNYDGPFEDTVTAGANDSIKGMMTGQVKTQVDIAQVELDKLAITARKQSLIEQLKLLDGAASAKFDGASFSPEGIALLGSVKLGNRFIPHVEFENPRGGDYFDAMKCWIPGGRVDSFEWSWVFFGNPVQKPAGTPGVRTETDSFLLLRPHAKRNRFGLAQAMTGALPGLDGIGKVCLTIKGVQVHPVTGALAPVQGIVDCHQFGYQFRVPQEMGLCLRVCDPLTAAVGGTLPELGVMRVAADPDAQGTHNTVVLYLDDQWDDEAAVALAAGVDGCERKFAGLLVLVLMRDGTLTRPREGLADKLSRLTETLAAPSLVIEDVDGRWSTFFGFAGALSHPNWRILTPAGVVAWAHDGRLAAREISEALAQNIVGSQPAHAERARPGLGIGEQLRIRLTNGDCPPIPLQQPGGAKVAFVDTGQASRSLLRRLSEQAGQTSESRCVAAVVDGASVEDVQRLGADLDIPLIADPTGSLTRAAELAFTPTVLTLDAAGRRVPTVERGDDAAVHLHSQRQ